MPDAHKNLAVSAVATAPSPATSGTSLVLTAGHGSRFPTAPFNATIWPTGAVPDPTNAEIVRVTAVSTDTLTITRAQESTTARTVVVGDLIAATATVKTFTDLEDGYAVWTSFTPTASQGASLTMSGLIAEYIIIGKTVHVHIEFSVTSAGTAGNAIVIASIPAAIAPLRSGGGYGTDAGGGIIMDASPQTGYAVRALFNNTTTMQFWSNLGTNFLGVNPALTLASGDLIHINLTYSKS